MSTAILCYAGAKLPDHRGEKAGAHHNTMFSLYSLFSGVGCERTYLFSILLKVFVHRRIPQGWSCLLNLPGTGTQALWDGWHPRN
jgi:hypothetical protein